MLLHVTSSRRKYHWQKSMTDEGIHAGFVDSLNACRNFILFSSCSPSRSIFSSAKWSTIMVFYEISFDSSDIWKRREEWKREKNHSTDGLSSVNDSPNSDIWNESVILSFKKRNLFFFLEEKAFLHTSKSVLETSVAAKDKLSLQPLSKSLSKYGKNLYLFSHDFSQHFLTYV